MAWLTAQAISDLHGLASHLRHTGTEEMLEVLPKMQGFRFQNALTTLANGDDFSLPAEEMDWLRPLLLTALHQDDLGMSGFGLALASLLGETFRTDSQNGTDSAEWDLLKARAPRMTPAHRAVLARAFHRSQELNILPEMAVPDGMKEGIGRNAVLGVLRRMAMAITDQEIDCISQADYGEDVERFKAALRKVIWQQDCVMTREQYWYPSEVVELVSHVPGTPGYLPATALLMLNSIVDEDHADNMSMRWAHQHLHYLSMPEADGAPILAGFRHLYETCPEWGEYFKSDVGLIPWRCDFNPSNGDQE